MAQAPKSVTINGRTVTDPKKVAQIERNREASARYAADAYRSKGTPVPAHLRETVDRQAAQRGSGGGGGYTSIGDMFDGGGPGRSGATFQGGPFSGAANAAGIRPMAGGGGGGGGGGMRLGAGGQPYLGGNADWNQYTASLEAADRASGRTNPIQKAFGFLAGGGPGASTPRMPPSPGPNYVASLGRPGTPRDDDDRDPFRFAGRLPAPDAGVTPEVDSGNNMTGEEVSRMNAERSRVPSYEEGGYVGQDGMPIRPSTASLDLPPALARMLEMPMQSFAEGGMVGPGGMPQRPMTSPAAMNLVEQGGAPVVGIAPPGQQGRPLNFAAIDQQAQQFMQQNPQQVEQIRATVQQAMAAGEIDAQSLNMFVQVATTALQSPDMWPQLRQVLIQQGMLDAEDIGEEYDQGFLIVLYIIGKTMGNGGMATPGAQQGMPQQGMPQQGAPMSAGQVPQMSMKTGGALPLKSDNPDGSIPINAHEGEYVIPADVARRLGTDHFDKMIAKARGAENKGEM